MTDRPCPYCNEISNKGAVAHEPGCITLLKPGPIIVGGPDTDVQIARRLHGEKGDYEDGSWREAEVTVVPDDGGPRLTFSTRMARYIKMEDSITITARPKFESAPEPPEWARGKWMEAAVQETEEPHYKLEVKPMHEYKPKHEPNDLHCVTCGKWPSHSGLAPADWPYPLPSGVQVEPAPPVPDRVLPAPERDPDVGLPPWHRDKHEYLRRQVERPAWKDEVLTCPNCDAEFFSAQDAVVTSLGEDQPRNAARVPIHAFKGRSDRPCEMCGKPDRNPVHDERYG
jgi:hypothetical protein